MNTQNILIDIINAIKPVTITGSGSDLFSKVCTVIKNAASGVQHSFLMFEDQCVYLYTGTHWMKVSDLDLKVFLRDAYQKISSDPIKASQRDMIEGLFKQFSYTVMNFGVTQAQGKINFLNGTLDLGTRIGGRVYNCSASILLIVFSNHLLLTINKRFNSLLIIGVSIIFSVSKHIISFILCCF